MIVKNRKEVTIIVSMTVKQAYSLVTVREVISRQLLTDCLKGHCPMITPDEIEAVFIALDDLGSSLHAGLDDV